MKLIIENKQFFIEIYIIAELESGCVSVLPVEAASEMGDARLKSALIDLQEYWDLNIELLQEAISSCNPKNSE